MIKDKNIQEGDYTYTPGYNFYSRLETISTLQNLLDRGLIDQYFFDTISVYQKSFQKEYYTPQEISQYYKQVLDKELRERFPLNIEGPNMPLETLVSI
jgi:hypothetical protein